MLDPDLQKRILDGVEANFADQIAYLDTLVRCPSRRGAEQAVQDRVFHAWRSRGFAMERFAMDEAAIGRHPGGSPFSQDHSHSPIVVGIHRPRDDKGRSLILQGHVDVVPEGPLDMWTSPPYEPRIEGDWYYGRGAGDMKAGHSALLAVFDVLRRVGLQPAATVTLQSVVEEESTGNGALMCHLRGYKAEAALIPEPTAHTLTRANVGVVWFQIEVRGLPVHVKEAGSGRNAIEAAFGVMQALHALEARWNEKAAAYPMFQETPHPINLNIGKIEGGDWASSVPAWCRFDCRISIFPGETPNTMKRAIEETVVAAARSNAFLANSPPKIIWNGFTTEGFILEPGSEAETVLGRAHQAVFDEPLAASIMPAYLDGRVYALYDKIPILNYGCKAENAHGFNERFGLMSLKQITGSVTLFVAEWCGVEPL